MARRPVKIDYRCELSAYVGWLVLPHVLGRICLILLLAHHLVPNPPSMVCFLLQSRDSPDLFVPSSNSATRTCTPRVSHHPKIRTWLLPARPAMTTCPAPRGTQLGTSLDNVYHHDIIPFHLVKATFPIQLRCLPPSMPPPTKLLRQDVA